MFAREIWFCINYFSTVTHLSELVKEYTNSLHFHKSTAKLQLHPNLLYHSIYSCNELKI